MADYGYSLEGQYSGAEVKKLQIFDQVLNKLNDDRRYEERKALAQWRTTIKAAARQRIGTFPDVMKPSTSTWRSASRAHC